MTYGLIASRSSPDILVQPADLAEHRSVRLGMPHLAFSGLSESWLLKDCGHRHWKSLTAAFNVPTDQLSDNAGDRIYASFVACRVVGPLAGFFEGEDIRISSTLYQISKNRFLSTHQVAGARGGSVLVEMISILLKRESFGKNCTLVSSEPATIPRNVNVGTPPGCTLPAADKTIRQRKWAEYRGYANIPGDPTGQNYACRPAPSLDFNGAQLLYFVSYQQFIDRAEWERGIARSPSLTTTERELFYFANVSAGDCVLVQFVKLDMDVPERLSHHCLLFRGSDRRLIAEIFTWKGE